FINTDNLMIATLQNESAVGWYAAANKILWMVFLIPHMFMMVIFPVLSRVSVLSPDTLRQIYSKSFYYLLMISFPIAVGGFLLSDQIILGIYGEQFRNSVLIFKVMVWVVIFCFVGWVNGATLNATGREKLFAGTYSCFALANIVLDYFFIRRFGYIGACYVTLILNGIDFFFYSILCHRQLSIKPEWSIIRKSLVASVTMGGIIYLLKKISVSVLIMIPVGAVAFLGLILLQRTLPKEDIIALRNLVGRFSVSPSS
ncbi:polysaccharide biosynthesis C-terminal domain-containing protein, partial [bacterium]|nr:polysaccharide biosynthesis C-terminal domain-containing protein [bacterium]